MFHDTEDRGSVRCSRARSASRLGKQASTSEKVLINTYPRLQSDCAKSFRTDANSPKDQAEQKTLCSLRSRHSGSPPKSRETEAQSRPKMNHPGVAGYPGHVIVRN